MTTQIQIDKIEVLDRVEFLEVGQTLVGEVYQVSPDTNSILVDFAKSNRPKSWITLTNQFLIRVGRQSRNDITGQVVTK